MGRCVYRGKSSCGNEIWGSNVCAFDVTDAVIRFCRRGFGMKYRDYWVYPVYFDDMYLRYTSKFYREVGVKLLPKLTQVVRTQGMTEDVYRSLLYSASQKDHDKHMLRGNKPLYCVVKGSRTPQGVERFVYVSIVDKLVV